MDTKFYLDLKDFLEDHKSRIQLRGFEVSDMKTTYNKGMTFKEPIEYSQELRIVVNAEDFEKLRREGLL